MPELTLWMAGLYGNSCLKQLKVTLVSRALMYITTVGGCTGNDGLLAVRYI